jgi:hypothetical protein
LPLNTKEPFSVSKELPFSNEVVLPLKAKLPLLAVKS